MQRDGGFAEYSVYRYIVSGLSRKSHRELLYLLSEMAQILRKSASARLTSQTVSLSEVV